MKFSVLMSVYKNDNAEYLIEALRSIYEGQTVKPDEIIVVFDGPLTPELYSVLEEFRNGKEDKVFYLPQEVNKGLGEALRIGSEHCTGDYIFRMDADDISFPERFKKQVEYLDSHPEISVCATDAHTIDEKGKIKRKNRYRHKRDIALTVISNSIAHPSVMFRKSLLEVRNPIYNEEYTYSQDYELWQFLLLKGHKFHTLDIPLLLYRKNRRQISYVKRRKQVELFK